MWIVGHVCVCVCPVCVFVAKNEYVNNFFLFRGQPHLFFLAAIPDSHCFQLSSGTQPPRPAACWSFWVSWDVESPPFRLQPRVSESFPPFSAVLLHVINPFDGPPLWTWIDKSL